MSVGSGPEDSIVATLRCVFSTQVPAPDSPPPPPTSPSIPGTPLVAISSLDETDTELGTETARKSVSQGKELGGLELAMAGELKVCVAWDRRHKFFPGQRIIVRFRLVG